MRSHVHSNENPFFTLEVKDCLETLSTSDINETTLVGYLIKVGTVNSLRLLECEFYFDCGISTLLHSFNDGKLFSFFFLTDVIHS